MNGSIDWSDIPAQVIVAIISSFVIGFFIPGGKAGAVLASKCSKPGSFLFSLIMFMTILIIMLVFMCPILTIFIGCVIEGAPLIAVLPSSYALFIPFLGIGILILMIIGNPVSRLARKCAGINSQISE